MTARLMSAVPAAGHEHLPLSTEPAGPTASSPLQGCYLICLDQPYFHARHYVVIQTWAGTLSTENVEYMSST